MVVEDGLAGRIVVVKGAGLLRGEEEIGVDEGARGHDLRSE
jgi:hypothetical protein